MTRGISKKDQRADLLRKKRLWAAYGLILGAEVAGAGCPPSAVGRAKAASGPRKALSHDQTTPRHRSPSQGASFSTWAKRRPWRARIYVRGREISLGYYNSPEEAKAAHAAAVRKHLGDGLLKSKELA